MLSRPPAVPAGNIIAVELINQCRAEELAAMEFVKPKTGKLRELVHQASRKAQSIGADVLVSHTQPCDAIDPIKLFAALEGETSDRWYWEHPEMQWALVSVGSLSGLTPPRNVRFQEVDRTIKHYASRATISSDVADAAIAPVFFVAYSFNPAYQQDRLVWQGFPSTILLTPRLTLVRNGDAYALTINMIVSANMNTESLLSGCEEFLDGVVAAFQKQRTSDLIVDELPPDESVEKETRQYANAVIRAEAAIRQDDVDFLTVARRRKIVTGGIYRVNRALKYLRSRFPQSQIVAAGRHGSTYIAYAESTLARKSGDNVQATCAAGSIRRADNPDLDVALAGQLLNSDVALEFHEASVDHIFAALEKHTENIEAPEEPELRSSVERHYFYTAIDAKSKSDASLLGIVQSLHPGVESSGSPTDKAAAFLGEHEPFDRGWLTAPFGWMNIYGDGEFIAPMHGAVIRAPLLEQQRAYLFTTTLVASGSDPEDKLAESDRRLEALRSALKQ